MIVTRATLLLSLTLSIAACGNGRAAEPSGTAPPASSTGFTLCSSTYALCTDADCTPIPRANRKSFLRLSGSHRLLRDDAGLPIGSPQTRRQDQVALLPGRIIRDLFEHPAVGMVPRRSISRILEGDLHVHDRGQPEPLRRTGQQSGQLHERHYFVGDGSEHRTDGPLHKRPELTAAIYA
jgi:hypothetical protein